MWPIIMRAISTYAPYVVLPFAAVIGAIGYSIEGQFDRYTPWNNSVVERREERQLEDEGKNKSTTLGSTLKDPELIPNNIFGKNTSPTLQIPK